MHIMSLQMCSCIYVTCYNDASLNMSHTTNHLYPPRAMHQPLIDFHHYSYLAVPVHIASPTNWEHSDVMTWRHQEHTHTSQQTHWRLLDVYVSTKYTLISSCHMNINLFKVCIWQNCWRSWIKNMIRGNK